jgi:hypothetical protein
MHDPDRYQQALLDPTSVYGSPQAVVDDARLTREQKIEVLRRWQYDADGLAVAEEEGMTGGEPSRLQQVLGALEALGASPDPQRSAPTKHDGG